MGGHDAPPFFVSVDPCHGNRRDRLEKKRARRAFGARRRRGKLRLAGRGLTLWGNPIIHPTFLRVNRHG